MPDFCPFLALLAGGYLTAFLGTWLAHTIRGLTLRGGRFPTSREAAAHVGLPPLMLLAFFLIVLFLPHENGLLHPDLHERWHYWANLMHQHSGVHNLLHVFNLLFSLFLLVSLVHAAYTSGQIVGSIRALKRIVTRPRLVHGVNVYPLPVEGFACFTAGLVHPRIYATESLLATLGSQDARAMLAHEEAHIRRKDTLFTALLTVFSRLMPLPGYGKLLKYWVASAERACDREAARRMGSACDVAAALLEVAGLLTTKCRVYPPAVSCFSRVETVEDVEGRVRALLALSGDESPKSALPVFLLAVWGVSIALALILTPYSHHFAELLFLH